MGRSPCNHCCGRNSGDCWVMHRILDPILIFTGFSVCVLNKQFHFSSANACLDSFFHCYFNDLIGSFSFCAFCNYLLHFCEKSLDRYWKIIALMVFCGFIWEVVTPYFRLDSVGDLFDFICYITGGSLYYGTIILRNRHSDYNV